MPAGSGRCCRGSVPALAWCRSCWAGCRRTRRGRGIPGSSASRQFPGLAPPEHTLLSPQQLTQALGGLSAARIGLVPAARTADVLPLIGWTPSDQSDALPVAAVVRSWEDRFGARLLRVGFAEISLLASRPPRSISHAQRIAAEHFVFCDECAGRGLHDVPRITASLMESPAWTFWWD